MTLGIPLLRLLPVCGWVGGGVCNGDMLEAGGGVEGDSGVGVWCCGVVMVVDVVVACGGGLES